MPEINTYTVEIAKQWARENAAELEASRLACPEKIVQQLNRSMPDLSRELWNSGCWLNERIADHGVPADQVRRIGMAHGQRSFGRDPWEVAVMYANEVAANGDTSEKGGKELADKIMVEMFEPKVPHAG